MVFAKAVQTALENHENVTIVREEITEVPTEEWGHTIIATGPLTSEPLANSIKALTGEQSLHFFDAICTDHSQRQYRFFKKPGFNRAMTKVMVATTSTLA